MYRNKAFLRKNGSSLASPCFKSRLGAVSREKQWRKIYKIEHPESILPVKSTEEKTRSIFHGKRMRLRKACPAVLVRHNHRENSSARRDNEIEIRGKHIFLIVALLHDHRPRRLSRGVTRSHLTRHREFPNYLSKENCFLQNISLTYYST